MHNLVVDDNKFDQNVIAICAKKLSFSVDTVGSGVDMLAYCERNMPNCILLDWEMGDTNGIELLKALRQMEGGDSVNVIICTSNSHPSFAGHAYAQGADGFITKPITMEKLSSAIGNLNQTLRVV